MEWTMERSRLMRVDDSSELGLLDFAATHALPSSQLLISRAAGFRSYFSSARSRGQGGALRSQCGGS